ncbi:MAG: HEPN domain-containing protein [Candidatus Altarchaeum sp.]|nr:HEPN domain-containing protein [Candidatus Altarchaeum sp.]
MANKELIEQYLKKAENKLLATNMEFDNKLYKECIGTAYYAMYHASCVLLLTKELISKTHKVAIIKLGEEFIESVMLEPEDIKSISLGLERRIKTNYDPLI